MRDLTLRSRNRNSQTRLLVFVWPSLEPMHGDGLATPSPFNEPDDTYDGTGKTSQANNPTNDDQ